MKMLRSIIEFIIHQIWPWLIQVQGLYVILLLINRIRFYCVQFFSANCCTQQGTVKAVGFFNSWRCDSNKKIKKWKVPTRCCAWRDGWPLFTTTGYSCLQCHHKNRIRHVCKKKSTTVDHKSLSAHACVQNAAAGDLLIVTERLKLTSVNITSWFGG